jgi:signal transduction histidine kinase
VFSPVPGIAAHEVEGLSVRGSEPTRDRAWLAGHKQTLAYALVAATLLVVVVAATMGGWQLHRAAGIERQTLRTQQLGSSAFQLQTFFSQGDSAGRRLTRAETDAAFKRLQAHDSAEASRIRPSYLAYVNASDKAYAALSADQSAVARRLERLESVIDSEIAREARQTRVTNPHARLALIIAAAAAALLIGLLIWQFEMQRRAGRIDRDNAEQARELMRLRDEFVATVSHELRTPLTSIMGYLELISDDSFAARTPEQETFLGVVQRNAERLMRLVSDLLLVAEAKDRKLDLDVHDVDLQQLVTECVEAAKPAADAKQIELTVDHGAPPHLKGDPLRLAQLMDNLVSNAIKFTPPGGRVSVRTVAHDGNTVLEVTDSGSGISEADQLQLFNPFFRTHSATAQAIPGTGLGLTITKAIVDAHKGSIDVTSALGRGTTFNVLLPRDLS